MQYTPKAGFSWTRGAVSVVQVAVEDIEVGAVVAEMHGHETNFGVLKGWNVTNRFEINQHMFEAMTNQLALPPGETRFNKVIGNSCARVVSVNEDFDGVYVKSVLVIYVYDFSYHIATLEMPS